jgi:methionyl-tRNA formyltransferase
MIVLREKGQRMRRRIQKEIKRVGLLRFFDVLAFRVYYNLFLARKDQEWQERKVKELMNVYPAIEDVPVIYAHSPNSAAVEQFTRECAPDIIIARCKTLLKESVFSVPTKGTLVMHPGICPEYRNAHGCFWALASGDFEKVGMTLLRIDKGVDTGPVFGYYSYDYDAVRESHIVIQQRVVVENLRALEEKLREIYSESATPLDTSGRTSAAWGQPWLTSYLKLKRRATRAWKSP